MLELSNERDPEPVPAIASVTPRCFVNLHPPWGYSTQNTTQLEN